MEEDIEVSVRLVQAGRTQEYHHIVVKYQQPILIYCWRLLGSRQEAEDAVQDILVNAFEKIHLYKPVVTFSSWLYKIAYHHCLNKINRKKLQQKMLFGLFKATKTADSAEKEMERGLFSEPLSLALETLTPEERSLLVLRVFEEKSFAEIGDIMNKSMEAVKKKYGRTITKLKQSINEMKEDEPCVTYKTLSKPT